MSAKKPSVMCLTFLFLCACISSALAEVKYQNRGNRWEGIKPKPVGGYDIELISVLVDYKEKVKQMPNQFKVKFYLHDTSEAHLTVRELDYKEYYWMDKALPQEPWKSGAYNIFEWPTQEVIQQLNEVEMYDLGVVARLEKSEPAMIEQVAPVIFYHSKLPDTIKGYRFTFKAAEDARLKCSFYKNGEAVATFTQILRRQRGGRPFTVRWDSSKVTEGSYKLVVSGFFLETNDPVDQVVYFYHKPDVN